MITTTYFSLKRIPNRKDCERLSKEYKYELEPGSNKLEDEETSFLGKGAHGKVYKICNKEDKCNFVLKVIKFSRKDYENIGGKQLSYKYLFNSWKKEIKNQLKVINCQKNFEIKFVPYVYDAWFCNEKNRDASFYIVMERYEGDLNEFINKFSKKYDDEVKSLLKGFILSELKLLEVSLNFINNKCKICLDDIKLQNILYKRNAKGAYELVFSDFGTSSFGKDLEKNCVEKDIRRFNDAVKIFEDNF